MKKEYKCKLNSCIQCEKGICTIENPLALSKIKPDSSKCIYFDNDFEKTREDYKKNGGTLGAIARMKGRKTPNELEEIKKDKRKTRTDKGKKRGRKKKEDTLLGDICE